MREASAHRATMKPSHSLLVMICALGPSACDTRKAGDKAEPATTRSLLTDAAANAAAPALTRVADVDKVCMVNDQYLGKSQIPVVVAGKTYFGCCPMCKEKLENSATARTAIDPVSGKSVDKASAIIARNGQGRVFYFESEGTLRQYKP